MYTYNYYKNFFTFYKEIYNYIKKNFFTTIIKKIISFMYIKMDQNNITSFENNDKSYTMIDLCLNNKLLRYKNSYNYYDIDIDKILLFRKSKNEYIIRYNDLNKMIVPLKLKINNSYNEINAFKKNNKVMLIYNDDK